mmetsp:Transcript_7124/g.11537  ORF Transcript_7124/g.11537 Transcript_7124/m.11537 type:complete len:287 (-) Transcript_7124:1180-2040(-)
MVMQRHVLRDTGKSRHKQRLYTNATVQNECNALPGQIKEATTDSYDDFTSCPSCNPNGIRRVKQDATLPTDNLSLGIRLACDTISWILINESLLVGRALDTDVSLLAPTWSPTVSDNPIVFCVADSLHSMIQGCVNAMEDATITATMEDTTTIKLPTTCCNCDRNWSLCRQRSLKSDGAVDRILNISRAFHCWLVSLALFVSPSIRNVALQSNAVCHRKVECKLHGSSFASTSAATFVRIFHTIHKGLWSEFQEVACCNVIMRLKALGCRECPTRTTSALILNCCY